ncbi:MAG TPA: hypothetical protein VNR38_20095 [Ureibacillus sp.]|nr:hypothetical protein [Ureibacillus sp.]
MRNLLLSSLVLFTLGLAACGGESENTNTNDASKESKTEIGPDTGSDVNKTDKTDENGDVVSWQNEIGVLVSNNKPAKEKYTELEAFLENYEVPADEVEQFKDDLISDYESKRYLGNVEEHQYMLSMLLKTHIIEQNNPGTPLGEFASLMHQNLKSTYFGEEDADSDAVKANESKMDEELGQITTDA